MAIIATVRQHDTWEGRPTVDLAKFIPEALRVFPGSAGYGGIPAEDPVEAAKRWAVENHHTSSHDGDHILIVDTQSPEWSEDHKKSIWPEHSDENDFELTWGR